MNWYTEHPAARLYLRALAVAVIAYALKVYESGIDAFELRAFVWGLVGAALYALVGLLTPLEPFVGLFKTKVTVPADKVVVSNTL